MAQQVGFEPTLGFIRQINSLLPSTTRPLLNNMQNKLKVFDKECKIHGITAHVHDSSKYKRQRCKKCRVDAVIKRRKVIKQKAVDYLGGKCQICELKDECSAVYEFHHKDPTKKDFTISGKGHCRSWERVKTELDKCILLCANCHRRIHALTN